MDAVYLVKPGDDNDELKFSLRSLAKNMPYVGRVFVVGSCPSWVRNVETIDLTPLEDKFDNQFQSLRAACADDRISEDFVLLNDDHFAIVHMDHLPAWHLGELGPLIGWLAERGQTGEWLDGLRQTRKQMRAWGYPNPNAYEAHIPLVFNRHALAARMDVVTYRPFLWGAAYDACGGLPGEPGQNVKVGELGSRELLECMTSGQPFLSTEDDAFEFGKVGEFLRSIFPDPCEYEEAT